MTPQGIIDAVEHVSGMLRHAADLMATNDRRLSAEQVGGLLTSAAARLDTVAAALIVPEVTAPAVTATLTCDDPQAPKDRPKPKTPTTRGSKRSR